MWVTVPMEQWVTVPMAQWVSLPMSQWVTVGDCPDDAVGDSRWRSG